MGGFEPPFEILIFYKKEISGNPRNKWISFFNGIKNFSAYTRPRSKFFFILGLLCLPDLIVFSCSQDVVKG